MTTSSLQSPKNVANFCLKATVQWIHHPDDYWILRNVENHTYLQVTSQDKEAVDLLSQFPPQVVAQTCNTSPQDLQRLLKLLALTGMLEGTSPPKPPKRKFTPLNLLYFRRPLINPDRWLTTHISKLHWIWSRPIALILGSFLVLSAILGLAHRANITYFGQQPLQAHGSNLLLPFLLLSLLVVSLHELGHAFTLKHYSGIVPEIGLLFMCLMPAAYTNTTDAYCLVKKRQRFWVVAAGVTIQLIIWAVAFWLWFTSAADTWLHTTSFLLMGAALFTVALNLNPLARFDGYYIAVALTGINNLRSRSFLLYQNLIRGDPAKESGHTFWILLAYAPLSLAYITLVFGKLFLWLSAWILTHIPYLTLVLLVFWLIYYTEPAKKL